MATHGRIHKVYYLYLHIHLFTYIHPYIYIITHTYIPTHAYRYLFTYMYIYYTHLYTYLDIYLSTLRPTAAANAPATQSPAYPTCIQHHTTPLQTFYSEKHNSYNKLKVQTTYNVLVYGDI